MILFPLLNFDTGVSLAIHLQNEKINCHWEEMEVEHLINIFDQAGEREEELGARAQSLEETTFGMVWNWKFKVPILQLILYWSPNCSVVNLVKFWNHSKSNIVHDNFNTIVVGWCDNETNQLSSELHNQLHVRNDNWDQNVLELVRMPPDVNQTLNSFIHLRLHGYMKNNSGNKLGNQVNIWFLIMRQANIGLMSSINILYDVDCP